MTVDISSQPHEENLGNGYLPSEVNNLAEVAAVLAERLLSLASRDPELKGQLRRMAQLVLEQTEEQSPEQAAREPALLTGDQVEAAVEQREVAVATEGASVVEKPAAPAPLPELTLGRSRTTEPAHSVYPAPAAATESLALIEARCRLKAEGARWAATRQRRIAEGANFYTEIEPRDRDIIARAKELPDCFLWMCHSSGPSPSDLALYEEAAGSFEAVAEIASLIRQSQEEQEADQTDFEAALDLLAEAQSALRVAIDALESPVDRDQNQIFHWLKATVTETQIFIRNHMRLDNPADPADWRDLLNRVEEVALRVQEAKRRRSQRKRLLGKVRHKTGLILDDPDRAASEWDLLIGTICELLDGGLPPSNRELRELLLPVVEFLPERVVVPDEFGRVLAEIDRYLAKAPPPESPASAKPSKEVDEAAGLLRGKSLALIGGENRPGASQAIKEAFGLKDLIWIESRA
ncbi:MAG TPA: hypothetical protein VGN42_06350, partial [Pirellulales bacterium]|nr:hypothetical protein [Pirellulales bacterium]